MILVVAEQKDGRLNRASWEAVAAAQVLAAGASPITIAVFGGEVAAAAQELAAADVTAVWAVSSAALASYTPDAFVAAVAEVIATLQPSHVCFPHTYQTRDFAPVLAAKIDRTLLTDITSVTQRDGQAVFTRPMFQGKLVAEVAAGGPAPHLVSFQIGAYRADAAARGAGAPVTARQATIDAGALRQQAEAPFQEAKAAVDLSQAERILAVGRGIKAQEHVALAEKLAKAFGAELAASRPICDNGWLPMERQIGSSGQTVAPKLYVAVGISGAIQHLVGMKGSRTIVAINKDAEAPIFEVADYGIQGDLFEIAPALIAELGGS
ncbi:MAG: electron transfer flavoprotein subunit alpha/FixB family protein [Vicinamibacterales bacterium]